MGGRQLIDEARLVVATAVNASLTLLYWRIGRRINEEILAGGLADDGKEILATLSQQLTIGICLKFMSPNT